MLQLLVFGKFFSTLYLIYQRKTCFFVYYRFSPNRELLAVSSENCCIDFFNIQQNKLTRVGYVTHIADAVQQMDWSTNSKYIRVKILKKLFSFI